MRASPFVSLFRKNTDSWHTFTDTCRNWSNKKGYWRLMKIW